MKKLHKNTNAASNSIRAYSCRTVCACTSPGCQLASNDHGMKVNTTGAVTLPYIY